ncbi:MAG: hypothetical protein HDS66_02400 [Bacteroidales bacterium]|nr:hypothetical protein [Bacteroidales bacterium]
MNIYKSNKLIVDLDNNLLTIREKSGWCCFRVTDTDQVNMADIIEMVVDNNNALAIATKYNQFYLKMNKGAASKLMELWKPFREAYPSETVFQKKDVRCKLTSDGYLVFYQKYKAGFCSCSKRLFVLCIAAADVVMKDEHKRCSVFLCTEDHAVEINGLNRGEIEHINRILNERGAQLNQMNAYQRAFRFGLVPERERIYTTAKGVAYYFKRGWHKSYFAFAPWDNIQVAMGSKGCMKRSMMLVSDHPIITVNKFKASDVKAIVAHVNGNLKDNAGNGTMYGKGSNKVYVTDTHVLCIGRKAIQSLEKPYTDGKLLKKNFCSSIVDLDGFEVKVGRNEWKGCICGQGSFRKAVNKEPSREIKRDAKKHRF